MDIKNKTIIRMKKTIKLFLVLFTSIIITNVSAQLKVVETICEYHANPIGIDIKSPRLSWKLVSDKQNVLQTAYEIRVADSPENLNRKSKLIWASGKVNSPRSVNVQYDGPGLKSMQRVYWQIRVWDNQNEISDWSEPAYWETGLLNHEEWKASWITMKEEKSEKSLPGQYYRDEFSCNKKISSARVYVTSLGIYQLFLNGKKVGQDLFYTRMD